jgi:indolepyruvate ferredoxin oxidoreductase
MPALEDRYLRTRGDVLLTGVQALVRLILDQRRADQRERLATAALISGYQGSPLAGLDIELQRYAPLLAEHDIVHVPGLNEELAATAIFGSQTVDSVGAARYDGVLGLWYGKAPGLDRAADAIRHANLMGVGPKGGALIAVGDDPRAKSSTIPSGSELNLFDLRVPVLYPADAQEVLDLGRHGFAVSRASGLWVGLKMATNVADGVFSVAVDPERVVPVIAAALEERRPPRATMLAPLTLELERSLEDTRLPAAREYAAANELNRVVIRGRDDRVGIVTAGKTYLDVREALHTLGLDDAGLERLGVRLLKLSMPFPLDTALTRDFARGLRQIVVVEEKRAFVELLVKDALYGSCPAQVVGKRDERGRELVPSHGELDADSISRAIGPRLAALDGAPPSIAQRLATLDGAPSLPPLPVARTPYFCSGCPHNSSTKAPPGAVVGGGIGCHGMVLLMDPRQVGEVAGLTQMGGEGAQWIGMAPFTEREHLFQNVGDGTFVHSGSLAIRAAVAAGVNVTFKILQNSAVAMTGGQTAVGTLPTPQLTRLLEVEGVTRTIVTTDDPRRFDAATLASNATAWPRQRILDAQSELARTPGVTALVHDQECAAEQRRKRKRGKAPDPVLRTFINERVCEGCGDCGAKSNCLSVWPVDTEFGRKTRIDQESCNKDYTCLEGDCPSFLTVVPGKRATRRPAIAIDPATLPEPRVDTTPGSVTVRLAGQGGTGVVTSSQILAMAGLLDGLSVRGLDQTGLAQKGGPVISDLRFAAAPEERANKLARAGCDVYIACDPLVAADADTMAVVRRGATAIVNAHCSPTGQQVADPDSAATAVDDLVDRIAAVVSAERTVSVDANEITGTLLGAAQPSNTLLLGMACQRGVLPMSANAIETAIRINGAAVESNLQAFRLGRQLIADPSEIERALTPPQPTTQHVQPALGSHRDLVDIVQADAASELRRLVALRVADLVDYQDRAYARRYAELVERVRIVEEERAPGRQTLAETVAFHLHKLMAYKDEYEVARLHLDPELRAAVEREFGHGARMAWRLHPPLLRALGLHRKLTLGPWFRPCLKVLRGLRRLRGTAFDVFGHTRVRRAERELIADYVAVVGQLMQRLSPSTHTLTTEIAALPDVVRGYEEIKLRSIERYRARREELMRRLDSAAEAA